MSAEGAVNRPTTRAMRGRLKLATRASLEDAGGASDLVREQMVRVGAACLSRCATHSTANDEHFVGIDTALDLDLLAGEPRHARALAEAQGWRLEADDMRAAKPVAHAGLNLMARAFTDAELSLREALEDGIVDAGEARAALALIEHLDAEIRSKKAKLLTIVHGDRVHGLDLQTVDGRP